ncbi:MAG: hypothetical protein R2825_15845 [Saprospiraceae bacterium]
MAGASVESVVVKHVQLPTYNHHPVDGIRTDGHQRKVKSYQVETTWYDTYSKNSAARLPNCLAIETQAEEVLMVLEDLDEAGFPLRKRTVVWEENSCVFGLVGAISRQLLGTRSGRTVGSGYLLAFGDQTAGISRIG